MNARNTYNDIRAKAQALEDKAWALYENSNGEGYAEFAAAWDAANAGWAEVVAFDREHGITEAEIAAEKAEKEAEHRAGVAAYWARYEAQQQLKQELTAKIPQLKAAVESLGKLLKACFDARAWPELDYKRRMAISDLEDAEKQLRWIP